MTAPARDELVSGGEPRSPGARTPRRLTAGLGLAAVLGAGAWMTLNGGHRGSNGLVLPPAPDAGPSAPPAASTGPTGIPRDRHHLVLTKDTESGLGQGLSALPQTLPTSATQSRTGPVIALAQSSPTAPILAIGTRGTAWQVRAPIGPVQDRSANKQSPLGFRSLSPDGRRAAFPQTGSLVVVDLLTDASRRYAVPGFNEDVAWIDADTVAIGSEQASYQVQLETGAVSRLPRPMRDTAYGAIAYVGDSPVQLGSVPARKGTATVEYPVSDRRLVREVPDVRQWQGPGFLRNHFVVRGGVEPRTFRPAVFVLDRNTGEVVRSLRLEGPCGKPVCHEVLGWAGGSVVLASHGAPFQVLLWHIDDGQAEELSRGSGEWMMSIAAGTILRGT